MKRIYFLILIFWVSVLSLSAQMTLEEINRCLDTRPYFDLRLDILKVKI